MSILILLVFAAYGTEFFLNTNNTSLPADRVAFRQKLRPYYVKAILASLLISAILSWFIPADLWKYGLGLCICTGIYLWATSKIPQKSFLMGVREPITATLYTLAVWGSTLFSREIMERENWILGAVFWLLIFQALLLQSHFNALGKSTFPSLARQLGKKKTRFTVYIVSGLILLVCVTTCYYAGFRYVRRFTLIFVVMTLCQAFLFRRSDQNYQKYLRTLSELVSLLPVLLI